MTDPFLALASSAFLALARSAAARLSVFVPSTPPVAVARDLAPPALAAVFEVLDATTCTSSSESTITSGLPFVPTGGVVAVAFSLPAVLGAVRLPAAVDGPLGVFALLAAVFVAVSILACALLNAASPDDALAPTPLAPKALPPPLPLAFAPVHA